MSDGSVQQRQSQPAVPLLEEQRVGEILAAVPERRHWRYRPRRVGMVWRSRTFRVVAVFTVLAICGLAILALVRDQTGTQGFLVGLGLAVLPVPLLLAAFRWLDRGDPGPWRNVLFAFAWGAFAAALVAILANSFATRWIATTIADPSNADTLGATVIAPVVEESAKAAAVLLIFLFRRREFNGIVDGVVIAGVTASGFAFTENILYLGNAFGEDQQIGNSGVVSVTAATFFVRAVMSPFAHPLFTVLTGIGFGLAAACARRRRIRRTVLPLLGLVLAMGMHSLWNGSGVLSPYGFYAVYAVFMVPVFGLVTWLVIWSRRRELRTLAAELPAYAAAGWLSPEEPLALSSMRARGLARDAARRRYAVAARGSRYTPYVPGWAPGSVAGAMPGTMPGSIPGSMPGVMTGAVPGPSAQAAQTAQAAQAKAAVQAAEAHGKAAARAVAEYESFATSLAALRLQARRGTTGPDFAERELELLHHLWQRREVAAPALTYAAQATGLLRPHRLPPLPYAQQFTPHTQYGAYRNGPAQAQAQAQPPGPGPGPGYNPYLGQQPPR
ncbi:PrsW family intramembrane metalloprotease [Streptomyces sp. NBC_00257]|uniref:PrsW family intramembrane metalloprotease n=1 Tax=unclassified Streptomyces TaxID=2593676 RepID=UPI0022506DDD|nr:MULTISPECIES: PrsW family intramembrane metalloprotease [unclassified Streptomyces]WTB55677.1 PrsW family intramembrane metalloprotease [Streptomyces sp. NBC_00826]WTH95644.1 PrsW family intramembrane metalloprotease [Streptomyces sp. NBC_00825]WTI00168.1 PrsW family intramembrane metalloprotease [Streptomyces sp. NBC_00822]MCX4865660.1 PrsW family intramembrane metalloprotease [Streptomyces sp. NBC_00906]MCX4896899.1 PrsW family intramembrane metalloprotease [Streptomyces sp. NBC_00892]